MVRRSACCAPPVMLQAGWTGRTWGGGDALPFLDSTPPPPTVSGTCPTPTTPQHTSLHHTHLYTAIQAVPPAHLSASSRITIFWRPGGSVTFCCANILILLRTC